MKATDTTLWTLVPFKDVNDRSAQRDMFLPHRYCRDCLRDNAEAAQSRRDLLLKNTDSSSSDSDGSSQLDPCADDFFVKGMGTRASFGPTDMLRMLWKKYLDYGTVHGRHEMRSML